ncbi:MAG: hypothetical protein JNM80_02155 [Phycisphaerae bacterium]|nr:hypothetical protein [Phycisphaerae bacterium]
MLAASLPIDDWQFWVATLIFVGAAWYLVREVLPTPLRRRKGKSRRVSLTVGGKAVR